MEIQESSRSPGYDDDVKRVLAAFGGWGSSGWTPPDKESVRRMYDAFSESLGASRFDGVSTFLNLGYLPDGGPQRSRVKLPELYLKKNNTSLVLELIGDCPLGARDRLLDVGCGRGGTICVLRQFFQVGAIVGLDLAPRAIEFCRRRHRFADTSFEIGDAENLPFAERSFELVTNVESSHNYGDVFAFFREAHRVLECGGRFLYTDMIPGARLAQYRGVLAQLGFELECERDVSRNVLASCAAAAGTHLRSLAAAEADRLAIAEFLLVAGSETYARLESGDARYVMLRLRKTN
jgi:SAM-dependent methyltransferase